MRKRNAAWGFSLLAVVVPMVLVTVGVYALNPTGNGKIVYWAYNATASRFDIFSVAADGSNLTSIIPSPSDQQNQIPVVSPDGTKIAYAIGDDDGSPFTTALALADIDGQDQTIIQELPNAYVGDIAWSPDNTRLVYVQYDDNAFEPSIWTIDVGGSNNQQVSISGVTGSSILRGVDWSSTDKLAYSLDGILYSADLDGTNATALTGDGSWASAVITSVDWSDDGTMLVFSARSCPGGGGCIVTVSADGSSKQVVVSDPSLTTSCADPQYNDVSFSPDGTKILYSNTPTCG